MFYASLQKLLRVYQTEKKKIQKTNEAIEGEYPIELLMVSVGARYESSSTNLYVCLQTKNTNDYHDKKLRLND